MISVNKSLLRAVVIGLGVFVLAYPVAAGTGFSLKCSECGFDAFVVLASGGLDGRLGHETVAVGYCCDCDKMVSVSYTAKTPEEEREKLKQPLGTVFSFETGKRYTLYACPTCGKPFIAMDTARVGRGGPAGRGGLGGHPIGGVAKGGDAASGGGAAGAAEAKLFCPKCGKQTLDTSTRTIME